VVAAISPSGRGARVELWTVGRDGSSPKQLTTGFVDQNPDFSPDGTKIVFQRTSTGSGRTEIWVMNATGRGQARLTTGPTDLDPEFSPAGHEIAFTRTASSTFELFTMNADGSGQRRVATPGSASQPAWGRRSAPGRIGYRCASQ
jgi:TolB protein